jgi:hypothetical protein
LKHFIVISVGEMTRANYDLDSSFTIEILGRAGLSQFINTPKRKLQEMQLEKQQMRTIPGMKENISVNILRTK